MKSSEEDKKISVIIPTYNRPNELKHCLESIIKQTVLPEEIIVIDDGNLLEMPCRNELEKLGIRCIFQKKKKKGLTRSRNLGIRISSGEVVLFFDDDVVLSPSYIEEIKKVYESGFDLNLGGVGGVELNIPEPTIFTYIDFIYNVIFLITPLRPGHVTRSGFSEQLLVERILPIKHLTKVNILGGNKFSFRKKVFNDFYFSEDYEHNYCQGEDKDFTFRVSEEYNLYINPKAKLYHCHSPIERVNKYRRGRDYILSSYRIFTRHVRRNKIENIYFFYALFGVLIRKTFAAIIKWQGDEFARIKGIIDAFRFILKEEMPKFKFKKKYF